MQTTIDDEVARLIEADRRLHGRAYMVVDAEGRIEHVPIAAMAVERDRPRERWGDGL